ncbi:MAG: ISL3 family transposase, partial [Candidatus Acidiferrales bacterium]
MQDRELYRRILGIETPWYVDSVELKLEAGEVHVHLAHQQGIEWPCPQCGAVSQLHDHQPERQWRHLDTCQYRTILHAQPPRSECPEHGVRVVKLPWAEPSARFTALFEALAIHWLQAASQSAVAGLLNLSWEEIHGIMERAVKRGLERRQAEPVAQIGVDEKAFRKGHKYLTLVNDLARGRVLYVAEDRKQSSLDGFWGTLSAEQAAAIEVVAMDMWDPYVASVRENLPGAESKIVFDKFHIAQHLAGAVDKVRRRENKILRAAGDDTLAGTRFEWLRHPARMEPADR